MKEKIVAIRAAKSQHREYTEFTAKLYGAKVNGFSLSLSLCLAKVLYRNAQLLDRSLILHDTFYSRGTRFFLESA